MLATQPTRIGIIDDHPCIIAGLTQLLDEVDSIEIVGASMDAAEAIPMVESQTPDIIILDLSLPEINGVELGRRLLECSPDSRILAFTMYDSHEQVRRTLSAGAKGYVLKSSSVDVLFNAINAVSCGGIYIDDRLAYSMTEPDDGEADGTSAEPARLTEREEAVLRYVALGYTGKEIAAKLSLSAKTVDTYKVRATEKLGLVTRADVVQHAISRGWMLELLT